MAHRDNAPGTEAHSFVVRDLRLPIFHPEEPVLFLPNGREVIHAFTDLLVAGIDPPIPSVARGRNGIYWYLGPVSLLVATGQSGRKLTARLLPDGMSATEMKVIAAKASLLRPIHWLAEARAWRILNDPEVREAETGFLRYAASKRRRVTELLRALQTVETLRIAPPHLEHRVVSAIGPTIAALDPDFAVALLREAERHQWPVRRVLQLAQAWEASATAHWDARATRGLPRLSPDEEARLAEAGINGEDLPRGRAWGAPTSYPLGASGLAQLLQDVSLPPRSLTA